jgi:integrase
MQQIYCSNIPHRDARKDTARNYAFDIPQREQPVRQSLFRFQILDKRNTLPTLFSAYVCGRRHAALTWHQLRAVLAGVATRDRMLLTLEMTDALRPSELFALRWRSFDGRRLTISETVYKGKIRPFGKTEKSLGDVLLPKGMVDDLWLWKEECPDSSPDAFIFPNTDGGFMDTGNYRNRILTPLAEKLGLPKLNFQVLRRTMATLAQRKGSVKDIQAHLRHSKADTTANEYMQELPESVGRMVESMYEELMHGQTAASADLLPNATNEDGRPAAICMRNMVGTRRLELLTSTVSR